jgi:hypothetical protein
MYLEMSTLLAHSSQNENCKAAFLIEHQYTEMHEVYVAQNITKQRIKKSNFINQHLNTIC